MKILNKSFFIMLISVFSSQAIINLAYALEDVTRHINRVLEPNFLVLESITVTDTKRISRYKYLSHTREEISTLMARMMIDEYKNNLPMMCEELKKQTYRNLIISFHYYDKNNVFVPESSYNFSLKDCD